MTVSENIDHLRARIARAAQRIGRDPDEIKLVAVAKTFTVDHILAVTDTGITDIGENRVQEADRKIEEINRRNPQNEITWHLVGHLQTNKVKKAVGLFELIQSVDSLHLAREIDRRCRNIGKEQRVLVQINTSGEETKFGLSPKETLNFIKEICRYPGLKVTGLMTIGLFTPDPEKVRPCFRLLRGLFEEVKDVNIPEVGMGILSMGMTDDFEVAIEEGANLLRIGRAIFGERA